MIHKIIHRLLLRRHFWRYATFSEVAELYASRMMRMMAINISAAFVSVFLYQHGYSIQFIAAYWTIFYALKVLISLPSAKYAAVFGPKHGILLSNLLYIPSMVIFVFVPEWGIPALAATMVLQGVSSALYDLCYMIDFSKVKSVDHAGKEIAFMNMIEKIAKGLSPFLGGLLAFVAGPEATMLVAAVLFALSAVPLFKTGEPIPTGQKLVFRGFPWRMAWRSFVAEGAVGFDVIVSGVVWSLLVAVGILGADGNKVYAELGALLSVVMLAALAASYTYGKIIDRRKGGELLRAATVANSFTHLMRPFVSSPVVVAGVNVANEAATTGYAMAFTRGLFDTADLSGHRVTYLGIIEVVVNLGATLACLVFWLFVVLWGDIDGMKAVFFVAAPLVLLIMTPKFRLYQK